MKEKENKKPSFEQQQMIELAKFKESLKDLSEKELLDMEQKIIKEGDEHNEARNKLMIKLPAKNYKEAATDIRMMLNTVSAQWQYALVLKNLYDLFDPENHPKEIAYNMLNGLLQQLSQASLKGYEQWSAVVTVSDYLESIREEFSKAAAEIYIDAEKHNMIVNALELFRAKGQVQEQAQEEAAK